MWVERRRRRAASWCSRATSASTTRRSCTTRGASSPPISCSWRAPTATAGTAAARTPSASSARILAQAARDGGNVIVPAFAIGRSQELLYLLAKHYGEWHLARWKIFLDSPMAIAASSVYWRHPGSLRRGGHAAARRAFAACRRCPTSCCRNRRTNRAPSTTCAAAPSSSPARGMANGGRVLHHLKHNLRAARMPRASSSASRRRARSAASSSIAQPEVRIHGQRVRVRRAGPHARRTLGAWRPGRICCAGMTASRAARRYTSCTAKCPRPKRWP